MPHRMRPLQVERDIRNPARPAYSMRLDAPSLHKSHRGQRFLARAKPAVPILSSLHTQCMRRNNNSP